MNYKIKDIGLATAGSNDLFVAKHQMPGLAAIEQEYKDKKPLAGARIAVALHITIQTAVMLELLVKLGADIRCAGCNIFSTQDHAAAYLVQAGIPVFAWKGQTKDDYWWCMEQLLADKNWVPNMLMDDGHDLTDYLQRKHSELVAGLIGLTEKTTTGVYRIQAKIAKNNMPFAVINTNDSVTKSKFDNTYGCKESLIDGIKRATDVMIAGKTVVVCGYGEVGKGCAQAFKGYGAQTWVTEVDPICALQAAMEGYKVVTMEYAADKADIFVCATGNINVIRREHMDLMKDQAIVCNIGHFDHEIDIESIADLKLEEIKPQVDYVVWPEGKRIILLAKGRLVNLACATGNSAFVMSASFSNQLLAQIELFTNQTRYEKGTMYLLPKIIDEHVARLHLPALGIELTQLTKEQADYLGVQLQGPYKSEAYRY